jgi:hypothetical protein
MNNSLSNWFTRIFVSFTDFRLSLWIIVYVDSIHFHQADVGNVADVSEVAGSFETMATYFLYTQCINSNNVNVNSIRQLTSSFN